MYQDGTDITYWLYCQNKTPNLKQYEQNLIFVQELVEWIFFEIPFLSKVDET